MEYTEPIGEPENDPYDDADVGTGFEGSAVPAGAIEPTMREIVHAITNALLTPSAADREQLRKAIQAKVTGGFAAYSGSIAGLVVDAAQITSSIVPVARVPEGLVPRNAIINGAMNVWQRGTTFAITQLSTITADRWTSYIATAGSGSGTTVDRVAGTDSFRYALRHTRTLASVDTNPRGFIYNMPTEDAKQLAGKQVTLSFYARKGSGWAATLATRINYGTGTDQTTTLYRPETWTGFGELGNVNHTTLSTSWQRFSRTVTIPAGATQIAIDFRWTATGVGAANEWLDITGVLLHAGASALEYPHQTFSRELRRCQRFYTKTFDYAVVPATGTGLDGGAIAGVGTDATSDDNNRNWFFPTEMRAQPTVTTFNPYSGNSNWGGPGGSYSRSITAVGTKAATIANSTNIGAADRAYIHATAEAELT